MKSELRISRKRRTERALRRLSFLPLTLCTRRLRGDGGKRETSVWNRGPQRQPGIVLTGKWDRTTRNFWESGLRIFSVGFLATKRLPLHFDDQQTSAFRHYGPNVRRSDANMPDRPFASFLCSIKYACVCPGYKYETGRYLKILDKGARMSPWCVYARYLRMKENERNKTKERNERRLWGSRSTCPWVPCEGMIATTRRLDTP